MTASHPAGPRFRFALREWRDRSLRFAASLFAPPRCRGCGETLLGRRNAFLCPKCLAGLEWIAGNTCKACGYPAPPHTESPKTCRHCRGTLRDVTSVTAVVRYTRGAKRLVTALKFRSETELAAPMAELMAERFRRSGPGRCDVILPVPLHAARRRKRGFNQADLLAEMVGNRLDMPADARGLEKILPTRPNSSLARSERVANVKHAFRARRDLSGRRVLLVDDVVTTGATMGECARACRDAGAIRVHGLVFAR